MNWFLYVVKEAIIDGDKIINPGQNGVGRCSMSPGIMEAPFGLMYVIPNEFVVEFHKKKGQRRSQLPTQAYATRRTRPVNAS